MEERPHNDEKAKAKSHLENNENSEKQSENKPNRHESISQESLSEIREAFNIFDKDGNGYITASELRHFLSSLGYNMTEAELMDMMNKIGNDKLRLLMYTF